MRNLASGKRIPSPKCKKVVRLSISYNLQFCKVTLEWLNYPPSPRILHGIINELPRTLKLLPQLYEGTYSTVYAKFLCQIEMQNIPIGEINILLVNPAQYGIFARTKFARKFPDRQDHVIGCIVFSAKIIEPK